MSNYFPRTSVQFFFSGFAIVAVCSGVVTPGGSSIIFMFLKWISAPSDSRQMYPFLHSDLLIPFTNFPFTDSLITPSTATITYLFHWPLPLQVFSIDRYA